MSVRKILPWLLAAAVAALLLYFPKLRYCFGNDPAFETTIRDFTQFMCSDCQADKEGKITVTGEDPWIWILGEERYIGKAVFSWGEKEESAPDVKLYYDEGQGFSDQLTKRAKTENGRTVVYLQKEAEKLRVDFEGLEKGETFILESIVLNPAVDRRQKGILLLSVSLLTLFLAFLLVGNAGQWEKAGEKKGVLFSLQTAGILAAAAAGQLLVSNLLHRTLFLLAVWMAVRFMTSLILDASERRVAGYFYAGLFFFYLLWVVMIPFGGGADEKMRYLIPEFIFRHGTLPAGYDQQIRNDLWGTSYGYTPTVCYILPALLMRGAAFLGMAEKWLYLPARMGSVIYSMAAAYGCRRIGEILFRRKTAWVFTAFVMLLPQYVFVSSYVNSDAFGMLGVTLLIWQVLKGREKGFPTVSCIGIGAGIALCLLSYYNTYGMIPVFCVYCCVLVLGAGKEKKGQKLIKCIAVTVLTAILLAGWWFIRNYLLYDGDFLGLHSSSASMEQYASEIMKPSQRMSPAETGVSVVGMMTGTNWWEMTLKSFVGAFGQMKIWLPSGVYIGYFVLMAACLTGNLLRRGQKEKERIDRPLITALTAGILATVMISVYYSWNVDFQPQGRYILPALLPFGILAFRGEERWSERMTQRIEKEFLPGGWLILLFAGSTAAFLQALSGY